MFIPRNVHHSLTESIAWPNGADNVDGTYRSKSWPSQRLHSSTNAERRRPTLICDAELKDICSFARPRRSRFSLPPGAFQDGLPGCSNRFKEAHPQCHEDHSVSNTRNRFECSNGAPPDRPAEQDRAAYNTRRVFPIVTCPMGPSILKAPGQGKPALASKLEDPSEKCRQ